MARTVIGVFDHLSEANSAVAELISQGFAADQVSLVTQPHEAPANHPLKHPGTGKLTSAGGLAGTVAGVAATLCLMAVPGLDPGSFFAAGPIIALLAGAGTGAATGGIVGALISMGVSHPDAEVAGEAIERGGALVTVSTDAEHADHVAAVFSAHHAADIDQRATEWETAGWKRTAPQPPTPASARGKEPDPKLRDTSPADRASIYSNTNRSTSARIYNP